MKSGYNDPSKSTSWKVLKTVLSHLKSFTLFITVQTIAELNLGHRNKFEIEFEKISRRSSRSPDNVEFGHFTLLFYSGRQRNVQRVITHVQNHCSAH